MSSNKLTDEHRVYVVKRLAAHETLSSIKRGLHEKFGVTVSVAAIAHYDSERTPHAQLALRWKELFWKSRKAYLASIANVGCTDKPARIRQRQAMMQREWAAGQHALANVILDSIAKDIGSAFGKKKRR